MMGLCACVLRCFSHVQLSATPWTAAHQAPLSMEFSRQEYWSGVPLPSPGFRGGKSNFQQGIQEASLVDVTSVL